MTRRLLAALLGFGLLFAGFGSGLARDSATGPKTPLRSSSATYLVFQPTWDSGCGSGGTSSSLLMGQIVFVWSWAGPTCPNLGIPLSAYSTAFRFTWNHDTTRGIGNKDIAWALTNMPWLVEYTTPVLNVTGTATNGSPTITGLSINPTTTAGIVANTTSGAGTFVTASTSIPGGSEIQSMTSSSITLNNPATASGKTTLNLYTPAWNGRNYKDWPVNFTDPTWRTFLFKNCTVIGTSHDVGCSLNAEVEDGFSWIGYDNLLLNNEYAYVGHFRKAMARCPRASWPQCGGTFVYDFTGANYGDPAWIRGVLDYLRYTGDYVHSLGAGFAINLGVENGGGGALAPSLLQQAGQMTDAVLTEAGGLLSNGSCSYGDAWLQVIHATEGITATILYDEDNGRFSSASSRQGTVEHCIVATLMMMANSKPEGTTNTYLAVQGTADAYTVVKYDPSWLSGENCGPASPGNPPHINSGGSYERDFPGDKCIVVYNPHAGTATTWTPPKGETFTDFLSGGRYTGGKPYQVTAPSRSGYGSLFIRIGQNG